MEVGGICVVSRWVWVKTIDVASGYGCNEVAI